jgi:Glycosyl hydrolase family 47
VESAVRNAGLFALGHMHGVNTSLPGEMDDLQVAQALMHTCYQMYQRTPTGLAPEIVFFRQLGQSQADFPKQHSPDVGGADFYIKHQVILPPYPAARARRPLFFAEFRAVCVDVDSAGD